VSHPQRSRFEGPAEPTAPSVSIWSQSHALPQFPPLAEELRVDTVIVGAGITGLSLGVRLARAGQAVAVVERRRLASGTTGGSTAHVTASLDAPWDTIASRFGEEPARVVAESIRRAMAAIETESRSAPGAAAFTRVPGYRVATDDADAETLDREADVAQRLGLAVRRVPPPARFPGAGAIRFDDQAEIDPVAYLHGLARTFVGLGGAVYEQSPVVETADDAVHIGDGRTIRAAAVVHATHTPIGLAPIVQMRVEPRTSYVLTARLDAPLEPMLLWDCDDPYHYVRSLAPDRRLVLIGGEDHPVGRCTEPSARLDALETWARARFGGLERIGGWSAELFETPDGLPLIGATPGSRQLVASGFSGTGITFGSVAADVLADLLLGAENPGARVYAPGRLGPVAGLLATGRKGLSDGWRFVADRARAGLRSGEPDVPLDGGCVVTRGRRTLALYRDPSGELHTLSARCTHLGCIVQWNDFEKTWDCPCHGGRFHRTGKVIYGPPTSDLARVDEEAAEAGDEGPHGHRGKR